MHNFPDGLPSGSEGFKALVAVTRGALPGLKVTIDFTIAEGDVVANRWTLRATHTGELMGIAATGKQVESSGMSAARIAGSKVVELWNESDQLVMMQQLGVVPPPGG
jgi:predicted ester cyclase